MPTHRHTPSVNQNRKAELANAYNELGKELSSSKIRVVGNYTLGRVIGEGAYGKVRLGTHRLTSTRVAIKQIPKAMSTSLTREIHHHRQLHHPHVTQMYEVIATESHIWIVTELCCGGELFDYLVEKGRLSEEETRNIFGQLCLAVAYLHDNNIVHRDLKLENVLLDERCRVKLGDFGFTREFERGAFMETFCGTTGYASPEMLQGKKYQGPEVDVWSLGIILYTLLTGTLPFDDDDESVMREKIIQGDFEDPTWLSIESRDLIKNILIKDIAKRMTIPQIFAHPWFTSRTLTYEPEPELELEPPTIPFPSISSDRPSTPESKSRRNSEGTAPGSSENSTQESSPFTNQPELVSSPSTTPEHSDVDPFESADKDSSNKPSIQRRSSASTIRRLSGSDLESLSSKLAKTGDRQPATVVEEEATNAKYSSPSPVIRTSSSKGPPTLPVRTPARTKRRSVSSVMSETGSPIHDKSPTPLPTPSARDVDFMSMLTANTPVMFSTPEEHRILNTLSSLGFDTAQIVHSVLSYACDSAGALWWMMSKKDEKKIFDDVQQTPVPALDPRTLNRDPASSDDNLRDSKAKRKKKMNAGVQTDLGQQIEKFAAPQFAFIPPTPTMAGRPTTPPQKNGTTSAWSPLLSPTSSSTFADSSIKSHPSTPSGSLKDKDKDQREKGRKARAGSVSIMQRATTALEAAGLVRKKSTEAVREEKEKEKKDGDRRGPSNEESRSSHGSAPNRLTKSPPAKEILPPSTPPPIDHKHNAIESPWVLADGREIVSTSAIAAVDAKGEMLHSLSAPNISETTPKAAPPVRNLLAAFRLWFNEERRGKRKEHNKANVAQHTGTARMPSRRNSSSGRFMVGRGKHRAQRPSISSHRSSSVNSRRSSFHSAQMVIVESPIQTRRSLGSHTPNSEPAGEHSSRPSSIRSFSMQQRRHRKSPSQSSSGSIHLRTASPMQKYHRKAGSGSSTRVVRQITPVSSRPIHARSNSATSSLHSPTSSRPTSFYEPSESEGGGGVNLNLQRTSSPYKNRSRSTDDSASTSSRRNGITATSTFVAHKRQGPIPSPAHGNGTVGRSSSRSSWKKSWGIEPPGWSLRTAHLPIEVIDITPSNEPMSIRDVFSGKQTTSSTAVTAGDDSDWVDEDDDIPALAGGLGQMWTPSISMMSSSSHHVLQTEPITLSPAPRGQRSKRNSNHNHNRTSVGRSSSSSSKSGHSPAPKSSPLPQEAAYGGDSTEPRTGRRQLPAGRSGPAFKHAIQEEDEEDEEEL